MNKAWILNLLRMKGMSRRKLGHLEEGLGGLDVLLHATYEELVDLEVPPSLARTIVQERDLAKWEEAIAGWADKGIYTLALCDPRLPDWVREIPDPPRLLFAAGRIDELGQMKKRIAVVGTRHPSPYGRKMARTIARDLAKSGAAVVSGMAYGIDGEAHKGALDADGFTIAVLGNGVDMAYPKSNQALYDQIYMRGVVLSEHPPGTPPLAHHFPERNRIVAALSNGLLVIEAAKKSGALITAEMAMEQGRTLFALPSNVGHAVSEGTLALLREGAIPVGSADHINEDMGWDRILSGEKKRHSDYPILQVLHQHGSQSVDEIAHRLEMDTALALSSLTMLEIQGSVIRGPGGTYSTR